MVGEQRPIEQPTDAPEFCGASPTSDFDINDFLDVMEGVLDSPAPKRQKPVKKKRRTKADITALQVAIIKLVYELRPASVRQIYYQLVSRGAIEKTEAEYKTVCRLLADMRRNNVVPYDWIADNTRWMRKPSTYSSVEQLLEWTQQTYRRALWDNQDAYVEIWLEKEALAGVLVEVTEKWDVPLMVTRGYPSLSFLHTAASVIDAQSVPACLYYFGDHDPSGVDIDRFVEKQIREIAPDAEFTVERVAVTRDQIDEYDLPTRPTKKSDSRSKSFEGESVEVDAIHPATLREICERCIVQHVDRYAYEQTLAVEEAERETLAMIADNLREGSE